MSDRHRRNNNNLASVTSHVGGGGGGGNNGGGNNNRGARRMVSTTPATAHVNPTQQQGVAVPHQWPSAGIAGYSNTDFMYRFGGQGAVAAHTPSDIFAPAPYISAGDVSMARQLQRRVPATEPKEKTVVNSQAFIQFPVIYNIDSKPAISCMPQLNGAHTQAFTTANKYNDAHVLLRRIVDCPLITAAHAQSVFEKLRHFRHPNLVKLNSVTPTNEFILGSTDIVLEYRMVKHARALKDSLLSTVPRRDPLRTTDSATEGQLWTFAVQLVGLIRSFHELKVPLRGMHYSKLLYIEESSRLMFTGLGLVDLVQGSDKGTLEEHCAEDIRSLGEVLLHLVTGSVERSNPKEDNFWERMPWCGEPMRKLIEMCLSASATGTQQNLTIHDICTLIASRLSIEVGHQQGHVDFLHHECSKSQENGRMMRLMMRLNLILACEEHHTDERYVLRLFHQYVFHQVDESGRPRLDWGHIYHCLNKLDIGSDEIIQMVAADQDHIIVASYEDIKNILESSFHELEEEAQRGPDTAASAPTLMAGTPVSMLMSNTPSSLRAPITGTPSSTMGQPGMRYGMFP